ncbi:hypothetical protein BGX38DRAFT_1218051 [Terfezia claveryi]|nr:hypothetical protein BGX38DRAFT_1218051 [Terfezia claveryi]
MEAVRKTESGSRHTQKKGSRYFHSPSRFNPHFIFLRKGGVSSSGRNSLIIVVRRIPADNNAQPIL